MQVRGEGWRRKAQVDAFMLDMDGEFETANELRREIIRDARKEASSGHGRITPALELVEGEK